MNLISKNEQNLDYWFSYQGDFDKQIIFAAANGSLLHQLLLKERITIKEFKAGFAFIKLYQVSMRSRGLKNRLRTYCQNWENISGIVYDNFLAADMEFLWKKILYLLNMKSENYKQILLNFSIPFAVQVNYPTNAVKDSLIFLNEIFKAYKKTKYKYQINELLRVKIKKIN